MQNEPAFPVYINTTTNSVLMKAQAERDFLKLDLGLLLNRSGYQNIEVMVYDDSYCMLNISTYRCLSHDFMLEYVNKVLEDSAAAKYSSGIATHWCFNRFGNVGSVLDRFAEEFPNKFLLSTEACVVLQKGGASLGNWTNFNAYAVNIINDWNHHVGGWIDWNMALDLDGGPNHIDNFVDAPVIVNATAAEYYKQPMFYALGHFTKFLILNSVRIQHQLLTSDHLNRDKFLVTVFERPDNGTVMIVLNKNNYSVTFVVNDPERERGFAPIEIRPNSLQSFVWY